MSWELFVLHHPTPARLREPTLVLYRSGSVGITTTAWALLGRPTSVVFLYDRARQLMGLRAAEDGAPNALKVRTEGKNVRVISAVTYGHTYGLVPERTRYLLARMDTDGITLCADVAQGPRVPEVRGMVAAANGARVASR